MTEEKSRFQIWKTEHPQWWRTYKKLKTRCERNSKRRIHQLEELTNIEEKLNSALAKIRDLRGRLLRSK